MLAGRWQLAVMVAVALWIWAEPFDAPVRSSWRVRLPVRAARIVASTGRSWLSAAAVRSAATP